jgi:hypothetical protein
MIHEYLPFYRHSVHCAPSPKLKYSIPYLLQDPDRRGSQGRGRASEADRRGRGQGHRSRRQSRGREDANEGRRVQAVRRCRRHGSRLGGSTTGKPGRRTPVVAGGSTVGKAREY